MSSLRRRVRKVVGGVLPEGVKERLRPVLGGRPAPHRPAKAEVSVTLDAGRLHVAGTIRRKGRRPAAVLAELRGTSRTFRYACDVAEGFEADIDLGEIAAATAGDTGEPPSDIVDLWLEMVPVAPEDDDATADARPPSGGFPPERVGRFAVTRRAPGQARTTAGGTSFVLDVTDRGNLSVVMGQGRHAPRRFDVTTRRIEDVEGMLEVDLEITCQDRTAARARLVALGRETQSRVEMPMTLVTDEAAVEARGGLLVQRAAGTVDVGEVVRALPADEQTIDICYVVDDGNGLLVERRLAVPEDTGRRVLAARWAHRDGHVHHLVPYRTYRAENLSFRVDRFTPEEHRYLLRAMRFGWLAPLAKPFTRIWLVGEVPYKAQDNGFRLFEHLRTRHPRRRAFYVITPDSPDRPKVEALGNVVLQHSRRHILYSVLASRLVGSHHSEYLLPTRDARLDRWVRGVRVFLQHGPTAQKNVVPVYGRQTSQERPTERFLVTSDLEKRIVVEDYGYRPHQVSVTGFARFDALFADDVEKQRTILIMPTWREGLARESRFLESRYYRSWHDLLASDELARLTRAAGVGITFVLHPNMRHHAAHFDLPGVTLVRQDEVDVQHLLKSSAMLITDYSSVAWDFSYLERPVLYFQFDREVLTGGRAPHIDFDEALPGPIATTGEALLSEISEALDRGLTIEDEYVSRSRAFLTHRDQRNCERIERVVRRAWNPRVAAERVRNSERAQRFWRAYRSGERYFPSMRAMNRVVRLLPRSNVVLFESDRGASYGDSPRYIYEELLRREHGLRLVWASSTTVRFTDPGTRKIVRLSPTYWWIASRARYWITNQNMNPDLRPGRRTHYLQTWHGTPLKKMQHDVPVMAGRDADYHVKAARLTSYWTTLLSPSRYATEAFRSAFRFDGPVLEAGYPRNDPLSRPDRDERAALARTRIGLPDDGRKVVLYAPTFRDDKRDGRYWRQEVELDLDLMQERLGDDYVLLVRFHPLVRNPLPARHRSSGFVHDVSRYPDVQELLLLADVLVTDYSSVFFDYAVLERPMIFFAYDLETYRSELRGFYLDYEESVPGPIVRTTDELADALANLDVVEAAHRERVQGFRRTYCGLDDGDASGRVVDQVFGAPARRHD
ncbi:CDP-glycerol glycerophosphotransferase family protein [Isoptericola sp. b515]|uniref:CDP-glycerol glycerophosphotransferase family protein n=1 Tax=Isoptericola sp. b515 TaxID=3064652 RepID=UPI0027124807|nr:CDP-glycerol glycerophosphotransferase family protein [Isoptericola sp. b515]MDO8147997.1 CDP-glycerol glycerophosphotransferase family protein [Isoptericola sp. b515]